MPPAPYKRTCRWGYLHEALEVEVQHKVELLFTPVINLDAHAAFLRQIAESDPQALHVVIMDLAGFHMREKIRTFPPVCGWCLCRRIARTSIRRSGSTGW